MKTFKIGALKIRAADIKDGVPIDPVLPKDFDATPNEDRPDDHRIWWDLPFIVTEKGEGEKWLKVWPSGVRYDVRCLDGGAWDRSTFWGAFADVPAAVACAKAGPSWRSAKKKKNAR